MSPLERDQADFASRLNASPYFVDVGVYAFRPRANLAATAIVGGIEAALNCLKTKAGKGGAAVTVLMPTVNSPEGSTPGPDLEERITIRVQELPLINLGAQGTMKSAESIAFEVLGLFHLVQVGGNVWYADTDAIQPNLEFAPKITYDVTLRRRITLGAPLRSAMPMIEPEEVDAPVEVTITAAPGATIYYTTNGNYPAPGIEGAVEYTGPFTLTTSALVRAVAYEANKQPSNVAQARFGTTAEFGSDFGDDFAT